MTLEGTNTYVVGRDPAWVIDPGPADANHIAAVRAEAVVVPMPAEEFQILINAILAADRAAQRRFHDHDAPELRPVAQADDAAPVLDAFMPDVLTSAQVTAPENILIVASIMYVRL